MDKYKEFTKISKEIFKIKNDEEFGNKIFKLLKKIIEFESGYIFFLNPERLEYSFNPKCKSISEISKNCLKENLEFKNSVFGVVIITGENFSVDDKEIFASFAAIISNIIKDNELTKVIKMQIEALQNGYTKIHKDTKKIIKADEVKTKFLSHITHELRTPLNSILGFSELLENEFVGKLNNKQKEYINDIKISGINLLAMINEILDMSRIESGSVTLNKSEFDIKTAVTEVLNIIKPLALKKQITIKSSVVDIKIEADYQKIQQILFNLVGNALKYTNIGGEINISVQKSGENLLIKVKDNGIGIEKRHLKKIFNRFEQINKTFPNSTGLGLAITKELVKLHKGGIKVESEPNIGSEFTVTIPLCWFII